MSYVVLCYAISWSVWFSIPLIAPGPWTVMKILVGVGMGPGLAAVILDRLRDGAPRPRARWWRCFLPVAAAVLLLNFLSLILGDGRMAADFRASQPPGFTTIGIMAGIATTTVCGFIFASAATSRDAVLRSITRWRMPLRWWLIAAFTPAAALVLSYVIARITHEEPGDPVAAGLPMATWLVYAIRSALFTFLVVGVGEEVGWRGWMLPELQKRFSALNSSIIIGVIWGFWHLPLFLIGVYPGGAESIIEYLFIGPLIAILITWLFNRTGGSLLLTMALHTAINNSQRVLPTTSLYPVFLTALVVAAIVSERMWRRARRAGPELTAAA